MKQPAWPTPATPHEEKLVVWVLLDTGLRVSELANLKRANLDWQTHRLMIYGKGGPFGSKSKRRVIPLSARIQPLIEGYFALHETFRFSVRTIQRMLKRLANRARISRKVSPHVLRHTFAVTAIQKGISLPALQRLLGHGAWGGQKKPAVPNGWSFPIREIPRNLRISHVTFRFLFPLITTTPSLRRPQTRPHRLPWKQREKIADSSKRRRRRVGTPRQSKKAFASPKSDANHHFMARNKAQSATLRGRRESGQS